MVGALLLPACHRPGQPGIYPGRGVVRSVLPDAHQVVIAHEAIPGLMGAMTMNFEVPDPDLLGRLEPGQRIEFKLEYTGKSYRVVEATVVGHEKPAPGELSLRSALGTGGPAPPFALTDQDGRPLSLADLRGKIVLLDFIYTNCPGPCPILTGIHVEVQRALSPELRARTRFVSISIDPARDTPQALRRYARARGADLRDWSFLTGKPETVDRVLAAYGVGTVRKGNGAIDHVVASFLIDPAGRVARRYLGLEHEPAEIVRDIEALAREAGAEGGRAG